MRPRLYYGMACTICHFRGATGGSKSQAMQRGVVVSGSYLPGNVASSTNSSTSPSTSLTAGWRPRRWDRQRTPAYWYGMAYTCAHEFTLTVT